MKTWLSPVIMAAGKLVRIFLIVADAARLRRLHVNRPCLENFVSDTLPLNPDGRLTGLDASLYVIDQGAGKFEIDPALIRAGLIQIQEASSKKGQRIPIKGITLSMEKIEEYITCTVPDGETVHGNGKIFTLSKPDRLFEKFQEAELGLFIINDTSTSHRQNAFSRKTSYT